MGDSVWLSIPHVGVSKKFDARWEGGWRVSEITGPVNVKIESSDGRIKVVHVNRLQPNIRRQDVGAEDVIRFGKSNSTNRTLMTRKHAITQNDSLSEGITEADITFQGDGKEKSIETSLRMDTSYPNALFNDSIVVYSRSQTSGDINYSITSSTPMKSTETIDLNGTNDVLSKGCRRSQRQRRQPKYLEDYQS